MQLQGQAEPAVKRFHKSPTLDQWLSHSILVPMASGPEDSCIDDTASSLGDSTYDFLDDKSGFTTDDEDASNLTKSISSSEAHGAEVPGIHQSQDTARTLRPSLIIDQNDNAATEEDQESVDDDHSNIKLDEPLRVSPNAARLVEGSHTLRIFDELEVKDMKNVVGTQAPLSQLKATVRQTMASHTLYLGGPFKILYIGDTGAKDIITQKIGSALTASLGTSSTRRERPVSSRFSVVPISAFGEARSPEVLLVDSLGIEIKVDHCCSATFARKEDSNDSISLCLSDDALLTSTWSSHESRYTASTGSSNWELPQLAIFYLSETESIKAKQTRRFARSFMSRHKVPCLVVTQSQLWNRSTEAMTLDYLTPHLCLETSGSDNVRPRVIKRLPIDLATFLNLDAVQVNRSLACLADASSSSSEMKFLDLMLQKGADARRDLFADETGRCSSDSVRTKHSAWIDFVLENTRPLTESPISSLFLLTLIFSCLGLVPYFAYSGSAVANVPVFQPIRGASVEHLKTGSQANAVRIEPALTSLLSSTAPLRTALPNVKAVTHSNTDLASFLLDSHALTPNNSAKFKVHVVGDRHIVLRPPHWFMRYRKAPKLIFNVTRKNKIIEHELSTLFDGVYALKVSREDAYGQLDVSVYTTSKPKINETFQVDFCNSWLRAAGWKNVARTVTDSLRGDVEWAQTSLTIVRTQTNTGVQKYTREVIKKMHALRRALDKVKSTTLNHTAMTTDLVLVQTKSLSQILSSTIRNRSAELANQVFLHGRHVRHDLGQCAGSRAAAFKHTVGCFSQAMNSLNLKAMRKVIEQLRQDHLRSTQKGALKAWWKLAGVPARTFSPSAAKGCQRKKGLRPKRKGNKP